MLVLRLKRLLMRLDDERGLAVPEGQDGARSLLAAAKEGCLSASVIAWAMLMKPCLYTSPSIAVAFWIMGVELEGCGGRVFELRG